MALPDWARVYTEEFNGTSKGSAGSGKNPPGYMTAGESKTPAKTKPSGSNTAVATGPSAAEKDDLKVKKAWEMAIAPAKQLPMTAFMMYMSGSSVQIFSVTMIGMALMNPVKSIAGLFQGKIFHSLESETNKSRLAMPKFAFFAIQVLSLVVGLIKMQWMGVLPTTRSDWLAWETIPEGQPTATWI